MIQVDRARPGVRVQVEGSILWEAQLNATRSGMHNPPACGFAFSLDIAASSLCLKRSAHVTQFESARAGFGPHRSRRRLLQDQMPASGLPLKAACYVGGADISTSSPGKNTALHPAQFHIP